MKVALVILAAGKSRRYGRCKALLDISGESFLQRLLRVFDQGGVDFSSLVVAEPYHELLEQAVLAMPQVSVQIIRNPDPSLGPISSIRSAWHSLCAQGATHIMVHPVDIPGVQEADVEQLLGRARKIRDAEVVVPSVEHRRAHPVLLRTSLAQEVMRAASLREVLNRKSRHIEYVESSNSWLRFDIDQPTDYEYLLAHWPGAAKA